jgi:hypothetical protein
VGENPGEALHAQTACDLRVLINIDIIITIHEPETQRLPENGKRYCGQHQANHWNPPALNPATRVGGGFSHGSDDVSSQMSEGGQ